MNLTDEQILVELEAMAKGIGQFSEVDAIQTETAEPIIRRFREIVAELKSRHPGTFDSVHVPNAEEHRFDRRRLLASFLQPLKYHVEHCRDLLRSLVAPPLAAPKNSSSAVDLVQSICARFDEAADRLLRRPGNKAALVSIESEKDTQAVLHAFLQLHFDDIRPEEPLPSNAGRRCILDFLLKKEKIGIEVKGPRDGLNDLKVGKELNDDVTSYAEHPDCRTLIFFVYDPQRLVRNPAGLIADLEALSREEQNYRVIALVVPPRH